MKFQSNYNIRIVAIATLLFLSACANETSTESAEEASLEENTSQTQAAAEPKKLNIIQCNGRVEVPPQYMADIHAKIDGYIDQLDVLQGQTVKKGQVLAKLTSKELIAIQNQLLQSKARLDQLELDFNRKSELALSNAVSQKELQQIKADLMQEKAAYSSAVSQLNFAGLNLNTVLEGNITNTISIVSPIDGFVNQVNVNNGKYITANTLVFQIIDESHKHIELSVFSNDVQKLKEGQLVEFMVNGSNETYQGAVFLINQALDNQSQSVNVHVHPTNDHMNLMVSSYVEASIFVDSIVDIEFEKH